MMIGNSYRTVRRFLLASAAVLLLLAGSTVAEPYVLGELVLKMQPGHTLEEINLIFGTIEAQHLVQTDVYLVNAGTSTNLDSLADLIQNTDAVEFCHPNYLVDPLQPVQSSLPVSDEMGSGSFSDQAAATRLSLTTTHEYATGVNVRVGILDGGIDYTHPALQNFAVSGYDYVDDDFDAMDMPGGPNAGHGTFVSGVVHLVAPNAQLRAYRVTDIDGESNGYLVAEAILQAVDDGCQVINLSMVTMGVHQAIAEAIAYAAAHEVLVVVAAGNGHDGGAAYPASDPNAFCVAALDTTDQLADFSNYGDYIDICAPGVEIYSAYLNHGYAWWGGTSFAAPFVAAQAALLLEYDSTATRQSIIDAISATADDIYDANGEYVGQLGAGLIDPLASLIALRGGASVLPVPAMYPTIQAAVDAAEFGDTILVAPGFYHESVVIVDKVLYLIGSGGPEETILMPAGPGQTTIDMFAVWFGYPTIKGFTFTGVDGARAVLCQTASPRIIDCIFRDNNLLGGDACIRAENSSLTVNRCIFYNNGGSYNVYVALNDVWPIVSITNNTFHRGPRAVNANGVPWGEGILRVTVVGNIMSECSGTAIASSLPLSRIQYNLFWNNDDNYTSIAGSAALDTLIADPLFVNPDGPALYLQPGSPAVDAGDPDPMLNDPDGTRNDIGALPLTPEHPVALGLAVEDSEINVPIVTLVPTFSWNFHDSGTATQQAYHVQVGTDSDWQSSPLWDSGVQTGNVTSVSYGGPSLSDLTSYIVRVRLFNGVFWSPWSYLNFRTSQATLIHVPGDVAFIREAVSFASLGDTIRVAAGTYDGNLTTYAAGIRLESEAGREVTILRPADSSHALINLRSQLPEPITIEGFTFQARGILGDPGCSFSIRNCRFENQSAIAIDADGFGEIEVVGNEFLNGKQAIRLSDGICRVDSNLVTGSSASTGISLAYGRVGFSGNVIVNNDFDGAVRFYPTQHLTVTNNTIAYNHDGLRILQYFSTSIPDTTVVLNNIVAFNDVEGFYYYNHVGVNDVSVTGYNDVFANIEGDRSGSAFAADDTLSVDPLFINPEGGDFSLTLGSPCIDAGNPDPVYNDPDGSRNDIGAIRAGESVVYPVAARIAVGPVDADGYVQDRQPTISWTYTDQPASTQQQYEIEIGTDLDWSVAEIWTSGPVTSSAASIVYSGVPLPDFRAYTLRVRVSNGSGWGSWFAARFNLHTENTIHVPADLPTVGEATAAALTGDSVVVAPGVYEGPVLVDRKQIVLLSHSGPGATTLQLASGQTGAVVRFNGRLDSTTVLSGFTIQGGTDNVWLTDAAPLLENNIIRDATSTGINVDYTNADLIVRKNVIENNYRGVDVYVSSRPVHFEDNVVRGNFGQGGVWLRSSNGHTYVTRNLFIGNANPNYATAAGGLYLNNGVHHVVNNTFYENGVPGTEGNGALRALAVGQLDLRNNIVALSHGAGLRVDDSSRATLEYNDVYGSSYQDYIGDTPGIGSLSADPLFADPLNDDYSLSPGSPCIDAGDTAFAYVESDWTRSDMGAISSATSAGQPTVTHIGTLNSDPLHLLDSLPTISWSYLDSLGSQTAVEVQVGTDFTWDEFGDWFSGVVTSSDTIVQYAGPPLARGEDYYARVRLFNGTQWGAWNGARLHRNSLVPAPTGGTPIFGGAPLTTTLDVSCPNDPEGDTLRFDYEFYADSLLDSLLVSFALVPSKSSPPVGPLLPQHTYYWRARTFDGYETSGWSNRVTMPTMSERGRMELASPSGATVSCGQPLTFQINVDNNVVDTVRAMFGGFRIWSPDGASFDSVSASWVNGAINWPQAFNGFSTVLIHHGEAADTVGFGALAILGPGLPGFTSGEAIKMTTEISCSEVGRTLCLDRSWVDPSYKWFWAYVHGYQDTWYSPVWDGPHCFTIEQCCVGERGNVNGDETNANLSDLTYLVNYLFLQGPPPPCLAEANINGDPAGLINLTDVTLLVNHAFITFTPLPSCGEFFVTAPAKAQDDSQLRLSTSFERDTTIVHLHSGIELLGVQLTLIGSGSGEPQTGVAKPFALYQSVAGGVMTAGLFDPTTGAALPAGGHELVRIPGRWEVAEALAVDRAFWEYGVPVGGTDPLIPATFEIDQNFPNPFNPSTVIRFGLPVNAHVRLEIINILGQRVTILTDRGYDAGYHDLVWDGTAADGNRVASGVYFYRLRAGSFVASKKMLLLK